MKKIIKIGGKERKRSIIKVNLVLTRSLVVCFTDKPGEAYFKEIVLSKWLNTVRERVSFLKKYNGTEAVYAEFMELDDQNATHIKVDNEKLFLSSSYDREDGIIYIFSKPLVSSDEAPPKLVTYKEFKKIVKLSSWSPGVIKEFKSNKEGKALLYNNNESLLALKKFVIV